MASDQCTVNWYPIDVADTAWSNYVGDAISLQCYTYFKGTPNADVSYRYTINYEYIPLSLYDRAGMKMEKPANPLRVVSLIN